MSLVIGVLEGASVFWKPPCFQDDKFYSSLQLRVVALQGTENGNCLPFGLQGRLRLNILCVELLQTQNPFQI